MSTVEDKVKPTPKPKTPKTTKPKTADSKPKKEKVVKPLRKIITTNDIKVIDIYSSSGQLYRTNKDPKQIDVFSSGTTLFTIDVNPTDKPTIHLSKNLVVSGLVLSTYPNGDKMDILITNIRDYAQSVELTDTSFIEVIYK